MYAEIIGAILTAGGLYNGAKLADKGLDSLDDMTKERFEGKSTKEKTIRVVANVLEFIGRFCAAVTLAVAGLTLWAPLGLSIVLSNSLPWAISSIVGLVSSILLRKTV